MNRRIAALALAAAALLGLTACTGTPETPHQTTAETSTPAAPAPDAEGDGGQSAADACALVQDTIASATKEFDSAASADPAKVVDAMKAAADKLAAVAPQVTNDEVASLLPALQEVFAQTGEVMAALVKGDVSKLGEMTELGTSMQSALEKFQSLCVG